ncbi:MAG: hypothetical protein ABI373_10020 [Flavobacteriales bacterium]
MLRTCSLLFLLFVLTPAAVHAQNTTHISGWEVVPDSLFLIWHIDQDQVKRLHVIEEDYDTERQHVASSAKTDAEKEARLQKLGASRLKEMKGVLGADHFSDWQRRIELAGSNGH